MAHIEINAFFTRGGFPANDIVDLNPHSDGKNYPRVRIWEVNNTTYDLVVGDTTGSGQNTDGIMNVVQDVAKDGFYSFVFTDTIGYSNSKKYLVRVDGGPSLPSAERYQVAQIDPALGTASISPVDIQTIIEGVWDRPAASHVTPGTMGAYQNEIHADVQQLRIDMTTALSLISTLLKYERNRTKIDKTLKTLTIYDDDGITPIKVFDLKDSAGNPSVTEVCERVPRP